MLVNIHFEYSVAEVYKNEATSLPSFLYTSATAKYTEGIKVNCKDDELKAKLNCNSSLK